MKRIILSRKGFDSSSGGVASPIFSDGRICSLPIPFSGPTPDKFQDVSVNGIRCIDALKESNAKSKPDDNCHYDPNLDNEKSNTHERWRDASPSSGWPRLHRSPVTPRRHQHDWQGPGCRHGSWIVS